MDLGTFLHLVIVCITLFGWLSIQRLVTLMGSRPTERAIVQAADEWMDDAPGARQKLAAAVQAHREHHRHGGG